MFLCFILIFSIPAISEAQNIKADAAIICKFD